MILVVPTAREVGLLSLSTQSWALSHHLPPSQEAIRHENMQGSLGPTIYFWGRLKYS